MPFGQLVIGSPGAGKTTYCAGAQAFLHALERPALVVNLDPANEARLLPYTPAVDINDLVSVRDVQKELGLGPNGALLYCMEYLEVNLDWLLSSLHKLGPDAYVLFDIPGQVELSTNHPSLRRILAALEKDGWRLVAVHMVDASHITDAARYVALLLLSLRAMLSLELPHINVLSKVDLLGEAVGKGDGEDDTEGDDSDDSWGSADEDDPDRAPGGRRDGLAFNLSFYTRAQDLSRLTDSLEALDGPRASRFSELNSRICELVEDFGLVGFETLAVDDKRSMLRLTRVIDKAGGYVYAPRAPQQPATASASSSRGGPLNPKSVPLPAQGDPELAQYEPGSLAATAGGLLRRDGAATAAALFGTADGDIQGWGEAGDVQERWVDDRARWDAWEQMQAEQQRERRLQQDVYREAGKVLAAEKAKKGDKGAS